MLERLRDLTREIKGKGLTPFGRKDESGPVGAAPQETKKRKAGPFCDPDAKRPCLTVCRPTEGCTCDAGALREALVESIERAGLPMEVGYAKTGCGGRCLSGPFIGFPQKGFFYLRVPPEAADEVVRETLVRGRLLFPFLSISPNRSYRSDILFERETGLLAGIDDHVCMVDVARYFLDFEEGLSCGKCVPCRLGMKRMWESVHRIVVGNGTLEDLNQIRVLGEAMIQAAYCEFAMASTRPVMSAVTYFEDEFLAHIEDQRCPAGVCEELVAIQRKKAFRERMAPKAKKKRK